VALAPGLPLLPVLLPLLLPAPATAPLLFRASPLVLLVLTPLLAPVPGPLPVPVPGPLLAPVPGPLLAPVPARYQHSRLVAVGTIHAGTATPDRATAMTCVWTRPTGGCCLHDGAC
jgi:hypothetical protein